MTRRTEGLTTDFSKRLTVLKNDVSAAVFETFRELNASGVYPLFGVHQAENSYLRIYFADACGDRRQLANRMVNQLRKEIAGFPSYAVRIDDIDVGDDGTMPSGWWLDE